jgi:hypothetical protein
VVSKDKLFLSAAILDPATGAVQRINVAYDGHILPASWTADGRVVAPVVGFHGTIWRFRQETKK